MDGEWVSVGAGQQDANPGPAPGASARGFLESRGLGEHAEKILEVTGASSLDDLRLIDAPMLEEVAQMAGLKLIAAKKLRLAIAELNGTAAAAPPAGPEKAERPPGAPAEQSGPDAGAEATSAGRGEPDPDAAGADAGAQPPAPGSKECIVICIDRSGSMAAPFLEVTLNVVQGAVTQRTRMEAVKAMFYAFRDRVESVSNNTHQLGLIQFDDRVETLLELTPQLDRFERIVDDVEKRGQTAIYSAVLSAARMLEGHFDESSHTDLRIVALTDGRNNCGAPPEEALAAASRIGAVVDAIIVGDRPDANLRKIAQATGGECYQISDLGEGFELLEAEGVASLRARRGGADKPPFQAREAVDFGTIAEKAMTRGGAVQRAPALAPGLAARRVVDVSALPDSPAPASSGVGNAAMKRILTELRQLGGSCSSAAGVRVSPSPEDLRFWRALVEGPAGSPFGGGVFALSVVIPGDYPFSAPKVAFETPVYHCNVSDSGKICLGILEGSWSPALSVARCLEAVRAMLRDPDTDNALRQWIAELTLAHQKSGGADTRYFDKARELTQQDASLTVAEWKRKWNC